MSLVARHLEENGIPTVVLGSALKLGSVIDFSDLMVLGMAFPNIFGMYFLSGKVKSMFDDYWGRLQSGEMKPTRPAKF